MVTLGIFEQGSGPVYLDEVQCTGEETQLAECNHAGFENHICGRQTLQSEHFFDVAIKCNGKLYQEPFNDKNIASLCFVSISR